MAVGDNDWMCGKCGKPVSSCTCNSEGHPPVEPLYLCRKCGLPEGMCVCDDISREQAQEILEKRVKKKGQERPMMDHFTVMHNAFATSKKFKVVGKGDAASLTTEDGSFVLDLSKNLVQFYDLNPRLAQWLLRNGMEVYFYTYHDVLTIIVGD